MFSLANKLFNPAKVNPHSSAISCRGLFLITYSSSNHSFVFVNFALVICNLNYIQIYYGKLQPSRNSTLK